MNKQDQKLIEKAYQLMLSGALTMLRGYEQIAAVGRSRLPEETQRKERAAALADGRRQVRWMQKELAKARARLTWAIDPAITRREKQVERMTERLHLQSWR